MNGTDIRLLLLPVAHPVLNPIELMWGRIKRYVRDNNCNFTMSHIRELAEHKIQEQDSRAWNASFQHTWKYATQQWQADELLLDIRRAMQMTRRAMGIRMMTRRHRM